MAPGDHTSARGAVPSRPTTLADYISILWRRKWIIIALPVVAGLVAFVITERDDPSYRAEALVLLNRANVVSGVTDTQDPSVFDSTRFLRTQANIARSPKLTTRVAAAAGVPGLTPDAILGASSVTPDSESDLLKFAVSSANASVAVLIANAYAREFTQFKTDLDTLRINNALEARGQSDGTAYETLTQYQSQLLIGRFLLTNSASVLQPAEGADEIGASPQRNFIAGALLGLVLALGIAFLAEALDRRVRTEEEIEETLGLPLLGRVSEPPLELQNEHRLVMLAEPRSSHSEAFRRLRTNIEYINLERKARTIMFTSAVPQEGKSTTVSNIAIAFARAGRRVALVDLDVRRPSLDSLFRVRAKSGIGEIVVNNETLDRALLRIALPATGGVTRSAIGNGGHAVSSGFQLNPSAGESTRSFVGGPSNGRSDSESVLYLLTCGTIPPASVEFLDSERISTVLEELGEKFDLVLVDAPPLLAVGDAVALGTRVDAIVVVTRLGIRRPLLHDLTRQLHNCPATLLGFVLTGAPRSDGYGYGYGYGYGDEARPSDVPPPATGRNWERV